MSDETVKKDEPVDEAPRIGPDGKPMAKEYGGSKGPRAYAPWRVGS